jgi:ribosomal protein S17E
MTNWSSVTAQKNKISIDISTKHDTICAGEPVLIDIRITNISVKPIQLTKDFTFTSNIYPNPVEQISKGTPLVFNIEPNPLGGNIWIEDQVFVKEIELQILDPYDYILMRYDLNKHLNNFISISSSKQTANRYSIYLSYKLNKKRKQRKLVTGTIRSNELIIYLRE